jgi:hypothetical protein
LLSAPSLAAEPEFPNLTRAHDATERAAFSLYSQAGLVEAPFVTAAFPKVSGFALVLTGTGQVRLSSLGWLRLRVPFSYVRLDMPAGAQVGETAFGNVELGFDRDFELGRSTRVAAQAAVLVPSAEHGSAHALSKNRALALGSGLNGNQDSALLTPGVTGLRLGGSAEYWRDPWGFRASLDLPVLVRISRADLPAEARTQTLSLLPTLSLRAAWWATSWFAVSLGGALVTEPWRSQEPDLQRDRARRLQPVAEPAAHAQLGRHLTLSLAGSIPIAGNLGGKAWSVNTGVGLTL